MKSLFNKGKAELDSHTYGHPILSLIPPRDAEMQIEFEYVKSLRAKKGF